MATKFPPDYINANHDAQLLTVIVVFTFLAIAAVILRLISRRLKNVAIGVSDMLVVFGLIIAMSENIFIAVGLRKYGIGRHAATLDNEQIAGFKKLWYIVSYLHPSALVLPKLSILMLYHRIFIIRSFRIAVWVLGVIVVLWWIGDILGTALICVPAQSVWNPKVRALCGNVNARKFSAPIPWIVTDFIILLMPLPMVWRLQLPRSERYGLCGLFLLGGFACMSSCIRYSTLFFTDKDVTWTINTALIWSIIEAYTAIISACLIVIKPLLARLFPNHLLSLLRAKYLGYRSSGSSASSLTKEKSSRVKDSPPVMSTLRPGSPFRFDPDSERGDGGETDLEFGGLGEREWDVGGTGGSDEKYLST